MPRTARRFCLGALISLAAAAWPAGAFAGQQFVKVTISTPAAGATVYGSIRVAGSSSGRFPITSVSVAVDQGAYQSANTSAGTCCWTYQLDTDALSNGTHTLRAKAVDSHGNIGATSESVTVNNAPPTVVVNSPTTGASVAGSITVAGQASSQIGIASVVVRVDNLSPGTTAGGTSSWSASIDTTSYPDGSHTISATATDLAGHSATASVTVTISNPLITTYQSPWWVSSTPGYASTVNETMIWDGSANQSSRLPTGTIVFAVNDTVRPNDADTNDTCAQNASTGDWTCSHVIATPDLQWNPQGGGWSVHYAFNLQVEYPSSDTFTICYSGDGFFAASSAVAQNT